ncbi:MAG TPA: biotin/lipoyl-containing protein [Vicinamibacterales bacterium]|jgi:biotin carboxyl carrier protein
MQYDIEVGGQTRTVTVVREGAGLALTLDGRTYRIDAARIDAHTLSLILDNVWSKDVVTAPDPATGQLMVTIDGVPVPVGVNGRRREGTRAGRDSTGSSRPQRVTAPMPGKVVRVLVKPGDAVVVRQPLVVVEAMKMENELRAGRDGTVADVKAVEGRTVDAGALLVVIQ